MHTPESLGIHSEHIRRLIDDFRDNGYFMHSFMILRHGQVAAEGYYKPFAPDQLHRMYSISKTFTSAAIGLLCDEGKLSLHDKVHTFFPDLCPPDLHPYIADATIRDLLMMASPFSDCTYVATKSDNWAWTFFNTPPAKPAGTVFYYDTSGTFILDALIERLTGMPFMEYLRGKLLKYLDFSENARCIKSPDGYSWGGSGVLCTTRDLAKFAQVFMDKGKVDGRQLLSEAYIEAATSRQIDNNPSGHEAGLNFGYGYQIWITKDNSYSFIGMGNQLAICVPDKDLIFVCTADNQGHDTVALHMIFHMLWNRVIDHLSDTPLPPNDTAHRALINTLDNLELTKPRGDAHSPMESQLQGVEFAMGDNPMGISRVKLTFLDEYGKFVYTTPRGEKELLFGYGDYKEGTFPETHYFGDSIGFPSGRPYRCLNSGVWVEPHKLLIKVNCVDDYFGNLTITLGFKGDELGLAMHKTAEWFLDEYEGFAGGIRIEK